MFIKLPKVHINLTIDRFFYDLYGPEGKESLNLSKLLGKTLQAIFEGNLDSYKEMCKK